VLVVAAIAIMLVLTAGFAWAASHQTSPSSAPAAAPTATSTAPATPAPSSASTPPPQAPPPVTVTRTETKTATVAPPTAVVPPATPRDPKYASSSYQCPHTPSTWPYDPSNQDLTLRTQLALRGLGYTVPANGVYDTATRDAVTRFQRNHGLTADGEAGSQTWDCIDAANAINQGTLIP